MASRTPSKKRAPIEVSSFEPLKTDTLPLAKAVRFSELKRAAAPLLAELRKLDDELKDFFRANPTISNVGEVGITITGRMQLDTKAVRTHLGDDVARFEKLIKVEQLVLLRQADAASV